MKRVFIIIMFFLSIVTIKAAYYTIDFNKYLLNNESYIYENNGITINSTVLDNKLNISYSSYNDENLYCLVIIDGKENKETLKNNKTNTIKIDETITTHQVVFNCNWDKSLLESKIEEKKSDDGWPIYADIFIYSMFGLGVIVWIVVIGFIIKLFKNQKTPIVFEDIIKIANLNNYRIIDVKNDYTQYDLVLNAYNIYFDDNTFITCLKVNEEADYRNLYISICEKLGMEMWANICNKNSNPTCIIDNKYKGIVFKNNVLVFYDVLVSNKKILNEFLKQTKIKAMNLIL